MQSLLLVQTFNRVFGVKIKPHPRPLKRPTFTVSNEPVTLGEGEKKTYLPKINEK